jgi:hypothetical protein
MMQHLLIFSASCSRIPGGAASRSSGVNVDKRRSLARSDKGAETNHIWWQRFWCVEVRPVALLEQVERELQLVEERQAVDRISDRGLMLRDIVHVLQSSPGSIWR